MGFTEVYVTVITVVVWGMIILGAGYLLILVRWPHLLEVEPAEDEGVNPYDEAHRLAYVTHDHAAPADTPADPGLSAGLSAPSVRLPAELEALMVDRSRAALVAALVAAGWNTGQIRAQLKGDNGVTGKEVEVERKRQGLTSEAPRLVPIAGGREGHFEL
jgi:hypothetical protein